MKDRQLLTIDEEKVLAEAKAVMEAMGSYKAGRLLRLIYRVPALPGLSWQFIQASLAGMFYLHLIGGMARASKILPPVGLPGQGKRAWPGI